MLSTHLGLLWGPLTAVPQASLQEWPKLRFCSPPPPQPSSLHSWGHLALFRRQGLRNVHCEVWRGGRVIGLGPQVSPGG